MTDKTKGIIKQEGLILGILLSISLILFLLASTIEGILVGIPYFYSQAIYNLCWFIVPFGYPIALLWRFIVWAMMKLKK